MNSRRGLPSALLLLALLATGTARAQQGAAPPPSDEPAKEMEGAPDPRKGERLDGRGEPQDPFRRPRAVGDVLLTVPRWLIDVLSFPVVRLASFIERHHLIPRVYWALTSEDELVGLRPEARYETGLIASLGARYFDRRTLGSGSLVEFLARFGGPRYLYGRFRLRLPHRTSFAAEWRTVFETNPNQLFSGTHGEKLSELRAQNRDLARYAIDRASSEFTVGGTAGPLWLSVGAELEIRTYRSSDSLDTFWCTAPATPNCQGIDEALVPGFNQGMRLLRLHSGARLDTRHGPRLGGIVASIDGQLAQGFFEDPSRHAKLIADVQLVLEFTDHLLILRADAGMVKPLGDAPVPFEELLSPTGNDGLRGMSSARLRGHSQLFGSVEYRWLLNPYLDAAVFLDHGGAFDQGFDNFSFSRMIPSYGFGLRIHEVKSDYWNAETLVRIQFAHASGEGSRFMLSLGND